MAMAPAEWSGVHGVQLRSVQLRSVQLSGVLPGIWLPGMLLFDNALCSFVGDPAHCETNCQACYCAYDDIAKVVLADEYSADADKDSPDKHNPSVIFNESKILFCSLA